MAPSALLSLSQADLQLSKAGSLSEAARSSLLLSAQMSVTNPSDVQLQPAGTSSVCKSEAVHDSIGNNQHVWLHSLQRLQYLCDLHGLRLRLAEKMSVASIPPETPKVTHYFLCLCEANAHARNDEAWNMVAGSNEGAADSARVQSALASFAAQVSTSLQSLIHCFVLVHVNVLSHCGFKTCHCLLACCSYSYTC